ncbi:MAG TPA: septum formation inhibitor Maf [Actinobacteria bacterium]|nr:septum formation inhibitor Maf [Actinomycetota bacterium]
MTTSPSPAADLRLVLASASSARSRLLSEAGIPHSTLVSGVDEQEVTESLGALSVPDLTVALAQAKARRVAGYLDQSDPRRTYVIGCDSLLEIDGEAFGRPADLPDAARRWQRLRGRTGILHTGHAVIDLRADVWVHGAASTTVRFGNPDDDEVLAYLASGEPLDVAGAFTLNGLSAPFIDGVDGDPSNVIGLSIPLLRRLLRELGVRWTDLWTRAAP